MFSCDFSSIKILSTRAEPVLQAEFVEFLVSFRMLEKKLIILKQSSVGSLKIFSEIFYRHL